MKMKAKTMTTRLGLHARVLFTVSLLATISLLATGCGGSGGSGASAPVATAPVIANFAAASSSITSGASTALNFTVTNATSTSVSGVGGVTGATSTVTVASGATSASVSPVETTIYTLTATNSVGSTTAKVTVTVNGAVVAAANCTTAGTLYTSGTGPTTVRVASAANFTSPLLFWLNNYFFSSNNNSNYTADAAAYTMEVCSDSTGNFESAIAAGTYVPNIFFAADTSSVGASYASESMEYAQGYPVLLGYTSSSGKAKTITGITDLIAGLSGGHADVSDTIASGNLAKRTFGTLMTTGAPGSLIASPIKAPYGVAAANIINAVLGTSAVTYTSGTTGSVTAYPPWLQNPASYTNITNAFNAIGTTTGAPTGFAAFSAICLSPPTGTVWVRFTGADVLTKQSMSNLEFNPGGGTEIYNLIKTEMKDSNNTWVKYITADYGFGSCYAGV